MPLSCPCSWDQVQGLVEGTWSVSADRPNEYIWMSGSNFRSVRACACVCACKNAYVDTHTCTCTGGATAVFSKVRVSEPTCTQHTYRFMQWYAGKCLTINSSLKKKSLICSICPFLWCKHPHHDRVQCQCGLAELGVEKRCMWLALMSP